MKKILYYLVLACLVMITMTCAAFIVGSLFGFDSVGVKGFTAGAGLFVIYNRKAIFGWLDKKFNI